MVGYCQSTLARVFLPDDVSIIVHLVYNNIKL